LLTDREWRGDPWKHRNPSISCGEIARLPTHHGMTSGRSSMDDWWSVDDEILACLAVNPYLTPAELGGKLGLSEPATSSLLALLAAEGKVRLRIVERADPTGR